MTKQLREAFDSLRKYYNIKKGDYVGSLKCFHEEYLLSSFMGTYLSVYNMLGIGTPLRLDELLPMVVYSPEGNACRKYKVV